MTDLWCCMSFFRVTPCCPNHPLRGPAHFMVSQAFSMASGYDHFFRSGPAEKQYFPPLFVWCKEYRMSTLFKRFSPYAQGMRGEQGPTVSDCLTIWIWERKVFFFSAGVGGFRTCSMGALLNSKSEFCFLWSDFSIDFHAHDYFTTHLSFRTCL